MTAYERYLVLLSQKGSEMHPEIPQEEVLTHLIREALRERHPMAFEIMVKAKQDSIYKDDSCTKAAQYLLEQYHDANS